MIKIVADTTSTIPPEEAKHLGIGSLPQIIIFGEKAYRDDFELTTEEFLVKLRSASQLPKTAAPPPALYFPIFEELSKSGDSIIVVCPTSKLSGTYNSATEAALEFPDADIRIVDTKTIGPSLGTLVMKALDWAKEGKTSDFIVEALTNMGMKNQIIFYVDTLEYLHKGGRIGAASALLGSLLEFKPLLLFKDGQITPFEKQRTKKKALEHMVELVTNKTKFPQISHLAILEADAREDAILLKCKLENEFGLNDIPIAKLPPAIVVHAGPGVVAVSFFVG